MNTNKKNKHLEGKKKDSYKDVYSSGKHEIEHRILWYKTKKPLGLSIWHVRPAYKEEVMKYALDEVKFFHNFSSNQIFSYVFVIQYTKI